MDTRDQQLQVHREPDLVVTRTDRPVVVHADPPARRRVTPLGLVMAALAVVLLAAAAVWATSGDGDVATRNPAAAQPAAPAAPAPLDVRVDAPAEVVAGEPATFTVRWTDGSGVFSGSLEEWGDGVGVGGVMRDDCSAETSAPASGQYDVSHTWATPGTYTVLLGVTTYTCSGGTSTPEDVDRTLTVEVTPAG